MLLQTISSLFERMNHATFPLFLLPIFWLISSIIGSFAGGWFQLSLRFSSRETQRGEVHSAGLLFRPAYSRFWVSESGIRITAASDALYLSPYLPFRLGRPPLRIPWNEIAVAKSSEIPLLVRRPFIFREYVLLTLGNDERIPFRISRHFSQGNDLMVGGGARHAGTAINRAEIGLAIGSVSTRRGSSQIDAGFVA
jgi:hypothetical protein